MGDEGQIRADKFLWSVRLFKTRAIAAETCKKGRVSINNIPVKPSRIIKPGEIIVINRPPVLFSYLVKDLPSNRVSAKLVATFLQDVTPNEELLKLDLQDSFFIKRDRGTGRPTKKERRDIDKLREQ